MNVQVMSDLAILQEANTVLLEHLGASKAAQFWAAVRPGDGDYLRVREALFANETVDTLYSQIMAYQTQQSLGNDKE
jgi:hypothetical protein